MLIQKDGIFRNIDERRLPEYKSKGFDAVNVVDKIVAEEESKEEKQPKAPNKNTKAKE
ncbi:MAG: hypothetical protein GX222_08940 [Ruminococcaceae bacterium]|nr:hypothetical protein [Oscillospiraceae bacterium]